MRSSCGGGRQLRGKSLWCWPRLVCFWSLRPRWLATEKPREESSSLTQSGSARLQNGYPFLVGHLFLPQEGRAHRVPSFCTSTGPNLVVFSVLVRCGSPGNFQNRVSDRCLCHSGARSVRPPAAASPSSLLAIHMLPLNSGMIVGARTALLPRANAALRNCSERGMNGWICRC